MTSETALIERLKNKSAVIGIVGLGYVGLPLVIRYSEIGYKVVGIDINQRKVDRINSGLSDIEHISPNRVQGALNQEFKATSDFAQIEKCDAIILCVPTPLNKYREPDVSFVIDTMESIFPFLRQQQVISLESTTYPGTTEEELLPRIEKSGLKVGEDLFLVYSPEREDPGNVLFDTATIPKVVGGSTTACLRVGVELYNQVIDRVVPVSSTQTAEMTKLLENIHRAVNIGLVNEMKIISDKMGIDIFEVIDAAATKPFGFTPYYPGPGLGGHCIPIDPFYLTWKAREYGVHTRFIELAGEVNASMPQWVVNKLMDGLNDQGKALKGSSVLVMGVAYKKNVDDMRESPSVEIMKLLQDKGAEVEYCDPHVPVFPKMRKYTFNLNSVELTKESVSAYDAIVLTTDHDQFDYELIAQNANLLVDTRGRYREPRNNLVKA